MDIYTVLTGTWSRDLNETIKGIVPSGANARSVAGEVTDTNYEFMVTVRVFAGTAAVLVNWYKDGSENTYYVELVLDPTNNTVKLDRVTRNSSDVETDRTNLVTRNMTIAMNTDYIVRLKSVLVGAVYNVYAYIDGFSVAEAEDLPSNFRLGKHGFECFGSADDYSSFKMDTFWTIPVTYGTISLLKLHLGISDTNFNNEPELYEALRYADFRIDVIIEPYGEIPGVVPNIIVRAASLFAAGYYATDRQPTKTPEFNALAVALMDDYVKAKFGDTLGVTGMT